MHLWLHIPEILTCVLASILAFFLPGYFFSKWLRSSVPILSAFVLSLMILCQGFYWLEISGIPLQFSTMLGWELFWTFIGFVAAWKFSLPRAMPVSETISSKKTRRDSFGMIGWPLVVLTILTGAILLLRAWLVPLTGPDLGNRWDQLAREVLLLHHYHFYPPQTPEDFRHFGFPESLPPMLTAVLWWLYASLGQAMPRATAPFVMLQYAVLIGFTARLAQRIFSPFAGAMAAIILAAAPLTFFSLVMGQEAGLIAVGALAMLYFLQTSSDDWRGAILTGIAASFAPWVREYAFVYLLLGFFLAIGQRRSFSWLFVFCSTTAMLTLPWYMRTWVLTGNPFYSLSVFGLFPVNPIAAAQYRIAGETRSIWMIPLATWQILFQMLLQFAPLQLIFVLPIVLVSIRRHTALVIALLVFAGLWMMSLGLSDSLLIWLRTLLPALAVISILLAGTMARLLRRATTLRIAILLILFAGWAYAAVFGLIYPHRLSETPPGDWLASALATDFRHWDQNVRNADFAAHLPAGCRVLSTDHYAWSAHLRTANEVVPLWSPEVRFIFDPSLSLAEIYARLTQLRICAVWTSPEDLHRYPANRLYAEGPPTWTPLAHAGNVYLYRLPTETLSQPSTK